MGVTIKDVAKKTGLSVTTVSLVLNKKNSRISEKTRQLIENAAQELNYTPNQMAVSLVTKKTQTIGVLLSQSHYYYFADLIRSIEQACHNAGYFPILSLSAPGTELGAEKAAALAGRGVDGLILDPAICQPGDAAALADFLNAAAIPVVTLGCVNSQLMANSISVNHRQGACLAASHLLNLGHRRIACLTDPSCPDLSRDFQSGFSDALEEWGMEPESSLAFDAAPYGKALYQQVCHLRQQGITGIAASSDALAASIIQQLQREGLSVPGDLSITGYGCFSLLESIGYPLTTLSVHPDRLARKAVSLIRRCSGQAQQPELISPTLIDRGSVQAVK